MKCMQINFVRVALPVLEILLLLFAFKNSQNFPSDYGGQK